jgi:hypothetical protein
MAVGRQKIQTRTNAIIDNSFMTRHARPRKIIFLPVDFNSRHLQHPEHFAETSVVLRTAVVVSANKFLH